MFCTKQQYFIHCSLKKKRVANSAVLVALFAIFFPWMHKGRGRKFFFPSFAMSISPSYLPKNPDTTHTPS
jgi:hypothetical protein